MFPKNYYYTILANPLRTTGGSMRTKAWDTGLRTGLKWSFIFLPTSSFLSDRNCGNKLVKCRRSLHNTTLLCRSGANQQWFGARKSATEQYVWTVQSCETRCLTNIQHRYGSSELATPEKRNSQSECRQTAMGKHFQHLDSLKYYTMQAMAENPVATVAGAFSCVTSRVFFRDKTWFGDQTGSCVPVRKQF